MLHYYVEDNSQSIETIKMAKQNGWKVCIYGLGFLGTTVGEDFTGYLGMSPDFYCDKSEKALKEFNAEESKKITVDELLKAEDDILVLMFIGLLMTDNVKKTLAVNKKLHIVTYPEMLDNDDIIIGYFDIKHPLAHRPNIAGEAVYEQQDEKSNGRTAVYTCIVGGVRPGK